MADILCGYTADRDETLVAYLYGDIDAAQRAAFEAHIDTCERCRRELMDLEQVRAALPQWSPPASAPLSLRHPVESAGRQASGVRRGWWDLPVWMPAAAGMLLVLGASAGLANLDVRYDRAGLTVRTGWSRAASPAAPVDAAERPAPGAVPAQASPWRPDLDALERRLRTEFHGVAPGPRLASDERGGASDPEVLRKVRALIDESARRQKNELALAVGDLAKQFDIQRGAELANLRYLRTQQDATGIQIIRQQGQIDYLTQTSFKR